MKSQDKMRFFEQSEFEDRLRKVKESMYRQGMEVLLVTDPANMNYLTGYDGWDGGLDDDDPDDDFDGKS